MGHLCRTAGFSTARSAVTRNANGHAAGTVWKHLPSSLFSDRPIDPTPSICGLQGRLVVQATESTLHLLAEEQTRVGPAGTCSSQLPTCLQEDHHATELLEIPEHHEARGVVGNPSNSSSPTKFVPVTMQTLEQYLLSPERARARVTANSQNQKLKRDAFKDHWEGVHVEKFDSETWKHVQCT